MRTVTERRQVVAELMSALDSDASGTLSAKEVTPSAIRRLDLDGDFMVSTDELSAAVESAASQAISEGGPDALGRWPHPANRYALALDTLKQTSDRLERQKPSEPSWGMKTAKKETLMTCLGVALNAAIAAPLILTLGPGVSAGTAGVAAELGLAYGCMCAALAVIGLFLIAYGIYKYCQEVKVRDSEVAAHKNSAKQALEELAATQVTVRVRGIVPTAAPMSALPALAGATSVGASIRG